jgi:hypothetical protein
MAIIVQPGVYLTTHKSNPEVVFLSYKLWTATFLNTETIHHTGAFKIDDDKWMGVNTKNKEGFSFIDENQLSLEHSLLWDFSDASPTSDPLSPVQLAKRSYLYLFYTTIFQFYKDFLTASPEVKNNFFKGRTRGGNIENSPGLVMKAIKTGFDIIGVDSNSALRTTAFTRQDILPYFNAEKIKAEAIFPTGDFKWGESVSRFLIPFRKRPFFNKAYCISAYKVANNTDLAAPRANANPVTQGFAGQTFVKSREEVEPALYGDIIREKFNLVTQIPAKSTNDRESAEYNGARNSDLVIVTAYGFRGDTRPPVQVRVDGGFAPNATRDDRRWVAELPYAERMARTDWEGNKKEVHASTESFLDNLSHQATWGSDYSGYVSFAKNPYKTLNFISLALSGKAGVGWIYAVKCRDAIDVEKSFNQPRYTENEISVPGGVEWEDVVGWRKIRYYPGRKRLYEWESSFYLSTNIIKLPKTSQTLTDTENKYEMILDALNTEVWDEKYTDLKK